MKYQFIMTYNIYRNNKLDGAGIVDCETSSPFLNNDIIDEFYKKISTEDYNAADFHITRIAGE